MAPSTVIPVSFAAAWLREPLPRMIFLSLTSKLTVLTLVIVPLTVRLPEIITSAAVNVPVNDGDALGASNATAFV